MSIVSYEVQTVREVDVLVVGGGCAGVAAAASAARHGAKVLLAEKNTCLGGIATAGLVGPFMTCFSPKGNRQVIKGLFEEFVQRMVALGGAIHPSVIEGGTSFSGYRVSGHAHCGPFDSEAFKIVAETMCVESGVELLYNAMFLSTVRSGGDSVIEQVIFATKAGLIGIEAKVVIDCTGDADVAYESGVPFKYGDDDGKTQPTSIFFSVKGVDKAKLEKVREETNNFRSIFYQEIISKELEEGRYHVPREKVALYENPDGTFRVNMSRVYVNNECDPFEMTDATIKGRKQIYEIIEMMRRCIPGCEKIELVESAHSLGVRESRRIQGDFVLSGDDIKEKTKFDDVIFLSGNSVDMHSGSLVNYQPAEGEPFQVPYRILLPKKIKNMMVAGRCCSLDRVALAAIRVMPPVFAMGQAAGTAASICAKKGIAPNKIDIIELQKCLIDDGAVLE